MGNSVYYLYTSKGRFILKIHQRIKADKLNFVLNTMEYARNKGTPVAKIIKNKSGKLVSLQNRRMITIQKFVRGKEASMSNPNIIKTTARTIGILDRELRKLPLSGKFAFHLLLFNKITFGSRRVKGISLTKEENQLHKGLAEINTAKLRKSVIHSDLGGNILYKNKRITAILDWDDTNENYLVQEAAIFIADSFTPSKSVLKTKVRLFLKEYQRCIKLNHEEKKAMYYMIKYRYLGAASWITKQLKTRKNKRGAEGVKWVLDKYKLFNRLSLEEFLKIIG